MIYDPSKPLNDPERTFGLAFAASPGGHAEMMRNWILEDATPYIDTDNIGIPVDWPFWEDREELAARSVLPSDQGTEEDDLDGDGTLFSFASPAPKKPTSADDKILKVLEEIADPLGLEVLYRDKNDIARLASLEGSTFDNALSRLVKADKIHRQMENGKEVRGKYGFGPSPFPSA
ncbi:hypothetical protein ACFQ51_52240 [Streptomyces kaempferi]